MKSSSSKKVTPNLPGSSRMQMPSGGGNLSGIIKETGGMKGGGAKGKTKMGGSKGKGMAKKSSY